MATDDQSKPKSERRASERAQPQRSSVEGTSEKSRAAVDSGPVLPSPSLPKGGGAISPIGEKLVPNPQMGTASFTVPVFTSPGRSGFQPQLSLTYDTGSGNGPYGLGWSMSVPNITRKTDKGLPLYDDRAESDTFILSGAEDLVPVGTVPAEGETVMRYRPRVDAAFARVERHLRPDGSSYWVSWTKDNVRSVYGFTRYAQLAQPGYPNRVFRWLLEWSDDDRGNCIAYVYKPEDNTNVANTLSEQNRSHHNLYLKAIAYGNAEPRALRNEPPLDLSRGRAAALAGWPLIVLVDYGEHDAGSPGLNEGQWPARLDPFSSYRSGFEIRTHRLCQRILMLHEFPPLGQESVAVRSTELKHLPDSAITHLHSVFQKGWKPKQGGGYDTRLRPEITFGYGLVTGLSTRVRLLDDSSAQNLPEIDGTRYTLVDYDAEGLPGVLTEQAGRGWFYKRPEGRDDTGAGRFGVERALDPRPASALAEGFQLQDVNGDGILDLVRLRTKPAGVFERREGEWMSFRGDSSLPNIDWTNPNLRFADLDGDGFPDVVIDEQEVFRWHASLALDGYAKEARVRKPYDRLEPVPLFATEREAVLLADMTGDGLSDVVHVRNGSVTYWPNLGYGRFGARVRMDGAPRVDTPDGFDPKRVRLADVDGTGASDLIDVGRDGVQVHLNQAGNSFASQPRITTLPPVDSITDFTVTDLWGTGTSCFVWSTSLPGRGKRALRWIDLLEGHKPHLLESIDNGFGALTTLEHAPSTTFYLKDRAAGLPWITKLPFPVQVLSRVKLRDLVAETCLVTTYQYHHGYYDGAERELRGFGMVEQLDTETVAAFGGKGEYPAGLDAALHIPPVLTKTWFHTGAYLDNGVVSKQLAGEYFAIGTTPLPDSTIEGSVAPGEWREALRALRSHPLRQEIYALDGNAAPYLVTENNYLIRLEVPRGASKYAVFSTHARETLTHHLERQIDDPRVMHDIVLRVGKYGTVDEKVSIGYPRTAVPKRRKEQERLWALHTLATTTPDYDSAGEDYRVAVSFETLESELLGLATDHVLSFHDVMTSAAATQHDWVPPDQRAGAGRWLARRTQARYWNDQATAELASGQSGVRALVSRVLTLALTSDDMTSVWQGRDTGLDALAQQGGYLADGTLYWAFAGTIGYEGPFLLPTTLTNPFGGVTRLRYETPSLLVPDRVVDPVGNQTSITNDYLLLSPIAITDPNQTTESVVTDPLGVVVATAVAGPAGEGGALMTSDYVFYSSPTSPTSLHLAAMQQFGGTVSEETWIYSDGSGREAQRKRRVEAGPIDPTDTKSPTVDPRFVGAGRTIFDNKGNPVKKYEPYFSATFNFDTEAALVQQGVTPILHYDPLGRLIETDLPNGTYSKVVFDAWTQETWDEIDTLELTTPWYVDRATGGYSREPALEQAAALAAIKLHETPTTVHLDALGRVVATVRDAGSTDPQRLHETSQSLDILGAILSVTDPRTLQVVQQQFDAAGRRLFEDSVDAGPTWTLPDVLGQPFYAWRADAVDTDSFRLRHEFDVARRLIGVWHQPQGGSEVLRERIVYRDGTSAPTYGAGRIFAELDGAGIAEYQYEFRGLRSQITRYVVNDPSAAPDWTASASWDGSTALPSQVQNELLAVILSYDAMRRELSREAMVVARSGGSVSRTYDRAGQLLTIQAALPGAGTKTFIKTVTYDAHGRRLAIAFGHGGSTTYTYDPLTFRLNTLQTSKGGQFQALVYAYDPVGNITAIRDDAQDTIYFRGKVIKPERDYTYDALYRLRSAVGREHLSQAAPDQRDIPDPLALPVADPNDLNKVVQYVEQYTYDPSGNFQSLSHAGATTWTRTYSLVPQSNQLAMTTVEGANTNYGIDHRGNMTSMGHLGSMTWDHRDHLIAATRTRVGNGPDPNASTPANTPVFFGYDQRGQRVIKQARTQKGINDRIYLAGFEIYRERSSLGAAPTLELDTLHVMDGDQCIALVETQSTGGTDQLIRYQHADHLGSAVLELNDSATPITYEEFHPYGTTALFAGLVSKRYRYIGKERDEESGFSYHGARHYAPWLARWTSVDPETVSGESPYSYVQANPASLVDLDGRKPKHPQAQQAKPHPAPKAAPKPEAAPKGPTAAEKIDADNDFFLRSVEKIEELAPKSVSLDVSKISGVASATAYLDANDSLLLLDVRAKVSVDEDSGKSGSKDPHFLKQTALQVWEKGKGDRSLNALTEPYVVWGKALNTAAAEKGINIPVGGTAVLGVENLVAATVGDTNLKGGSAGEAGVAAIRNAIAGGSFKLVAGKNGFTLKGSAGIDPETHEFGLYVFLGDQPKLTQLPKMQNPHALATDYTAGALRGRARDILSSRLQQLGATIPSPSPSPH